MTYFDQIYAINDNFDQVSVHKSDWNNFSKLLGQTLFGNFTQILTYHALQKIKGAKRCAIAYKGAQLPTMVVKGAQKGAQRWCYSVFTFKVK